MKSCLKQQSQQSNAPSDSSTNNSSNNKGVHFDPFAQVHIFQPQRPFIADDDDEHDHHPAVDDSSDSDNDHDSNDDEIDAFDLTSHLWYTAAEYRRIKRQNARVVRNAQREQQGRYRRGGRRSSSISDNDTDCGNGSGSSLKRPRTTNNNNTTQEVSTADSTTCCCPLRGLERSIDLSRKTRIYRSIRAVLHEQDRQRERQCGRDEDNKIAEVYSGFCQSSVSRAIRYGEQDQIIADIIYCEDDNIVNNTRHENDIVDSVHSDDQSSSSGSDSESESDSSSSSSSSSSSALFTPPTDSIRVAKSKSTIINKQQKQQQDVLDDAQEQCTYNSNNNDKHPKRSPSSHESFFLGSDLLSTMMMVSVPAVPVPVVTVEA